MADALDHIQDMFLYASLYNIKAEAGESQFANEYEAKYMEARDHVVEVVFGAGMRVVPMARSMTNCGLT